MKKKKDCPQVDIENGIIVNTQRSEFIILTFD